MILDLFACNSVCRLRCQWSKVKGISSKRSACNQQTVKQTQLNKGHGQCHIWYSAPQLWWSCLMDMCAFLSALIIHDPLMSTRCDQYASVWCFHTHYCCGMMSLITWIWLYKNPHTIENFILTSSNSVICL